MKSTDLKAVLTVPANAVTVDTQFSIDPANGSPPSSRVLGTVYDIEPTGTTFAAGAPPELAISYGTLPSGVDASTLTIGTLVNGQWADVAGSQVDPANQTVKVSLTHLSPYAVLQPGVDPNPTDNQAPTAHATGPSAGITGQVLRFNDAGSNDPNGDQLSYSWTFGDGPSSASGTSVSHTYANPGTYTVTLTVADGHGQADSDTLTVTISPPTVENQPPTAHATGPLAGITGQVLTFSGTGSTDPNDDPLSYAWTFGDGTSPGSDASVSHTYANPGMYTVTLTVADGLGGEDSDTLTVTISPPDPTNRPPTVSATIPPTGLVNQVLVFTSSAIDLDGDTLDYRWDFGDGTTPLHDPTPSTVHTYSTGGPFTVTLTVSDGRGGTAPASGQVTVSVPQNPIAFSQHYEVFFRQLRTVPARWRYVIPLGGSGVPPLTFRIVSLPTYSDPSLTSMQMVAGESYRFWSYDPDIPGWYITAAPGSSSVAPLPAGDITVDPPGSPPTAVYGTLPCQQWFPDSFEFTVTDGRGQTSAPATISFSASPTTICDFGTH